MHPRNHLVLALGWAALLGGCASVDPQPDFDEARTLIRDSTGIESVFDPAAPVLSEADVLGVLAQGLTLAEAQSLALMNNRRLQAGFLELGVGRAEFVQAGLLENPTLSLAFLFPSGGGRSRIGVELVESVAELWQLPRRKELAQLQQDRRLLELSRFAGELVVSTKEAYFDSVAARETRAIAAAGLELARSTLAGVQRQVEGGVATATDQNLAQGLALGAELFQRRLEREESLDRQRLAALLSLESDISSVDLTDTLPSEPLLETSIEEVLTRSQESRLDLRAAALAVSAAEAAIRLERSRSVPAAAAGVTTERPEAGSSTSLLGGLRGSIEIPLFDQNQAQISRAEYRRDALQKELEALTAEVSQEVRGAWDRAALAQRTVIFVEREVLPQAEISAALAQRANALGDTTVLELLDSQRLVLQARQNLIEARVQRAKAQVDLERSVGAPLEVWMRVSPARLPGRRE